MKGARSDSKGRSTGKRANRREGEAIGPRGPFIYHEVEMLMSAAWRALTINGRRVVERLQIEHREHAGLENGRLPLTFADLERWGVTRKYISAALVEAEALGFIERTARGRKKYGDYPGSPSLFRLTFIGTITPDSIGKPTDEWRRFETIEDAKAAAAAAVRAAEAAAHEEWQAVQDRKEAAQAQQAAAGG